MLWVTKALALRMLSPGCPLLEFLCFNLFLMSSHLAICLYAYEVVCGLETHFGFALVAIMLIIFTVFKKKYFLCNCTLLDYNPVGLFQSSGKHSHEL